MSQATEKYGHLTNGSKVEAELTKEESCAVLFVHDYGVSLTNEEDRQHLYTAIAKLKDQIWP